MAKISISNVLNKRRRFRAVTLLACLVLVFALVQMIIVNGGQKTQASVTYVFTPAPADGSVPAKCRITATRTLEDTANIPAECEGADVIIDGAIVSVDAQPVWQSDGSHRTCPLQYLKDGTYYDYDSQSGSTCYYKHSNSVSPNIIWVSGPQLLQGDSIIWSCPSAWTQGGLSYTATGRFSGTTFPYDRSSERRGEVLNCEYIHYYADTITTQNKPADTAGHIKGKSCLPPANVNYVLNSEQDPNCNTKRTMASLTLINGASFVHQPLKVLTDMAEDTAAFGGTVNGSLTDNEIGWGRWKKIDLVVTGETKISLDSKISADGAGYPGGWDATSNCQASKVTGVSYYTYPDCPRAGTPWWGGGWGPGGGGNSLGGNRDTGNYGGGGGYGNVGAKGLFNSQINDIAGPKYGDVANDLSGANFEWGSAGGNGQGDDGKTGLGGAGGGRISLDTDSLDMDDSSSITANGSDGGSNGDNYGGGGSGGTIRIIIRSKYRGSTFQTHVEGYKRTYTDLDVNLNGSVKLLNISSNNTSGPVISTYGALAKRDSEVGDWKANMGAGAGGRIYIQQTAVPLVTVSKKLVPNNRVGATPPNNFNPYALQMGDIIQVQLELGTFSGTISLKDEYLKTSGVTCVNDTSGGHAPNNSGVADNTAKTITWFGITQAMSPLIYYCKVQ